MLRQNEKGMTLVEVLVAMAMLAVLGTVLLAVFTQSYRVKTEAGRLTVAGNLAQQKLEELRLEDFARLSSQGSEAATLAFAPTRVGDYVYWVEVVTPLANPNLKEVIVNVNWPGSGGRTVSLGTLVGNK
ncbi:MAG: type II secretion system protein [Clostridia bacterium]|nr:type II secretion system protein [Clostridia bacterium]